MLRRNGCFGADAVDRERAVHYPGDFVPWVFATVERWKRLAVATLQVDAYLALLVGQPPLLRRDELDLGLPSTFAMWNAFGLQVFFPRHHSEPWRRGALKLSCLDMGHPQLLPAGGVLVEDVHVCLLGTWNDVCVLHRLRRHRQDDAAAVARHLGHCKLQLDALDGPCSDFLLHAYSARELPTDPKWRDRVEARVRDRLLAARMLYHLLHLHLRADVQAMRDVSAASPPGSDQDPPAWHPKALQVHQWAASSDSRAALLHALLVWATYQDVAPRADPADPIVYMALSAAAMVLWTWAINAVPACVCGPGVLRVDAAEGSPDVDDWILGGTGALALGGVPVCRCNVASWLTGFAEALARGGERWELGSIAANNCLSRLDFPPTPAPC